MSRPSSDTYRRLIEAGRVLMPVSGMASLSVRKICRHAGVNLGMFHYHFGRKDVFADKVLQDLYDRFFKEFKIDVSDKGDARSRLRAAMMTLALKVRDDRRIVVPLLYDAIAGYRPARRFLISVIPRHDIVFYRLIKEAIRKGSFKKLSPLLILLSLEGVSVITCIFYGIMERALQKSGLSLPLKLLYGRHFVSNKAIEKRIDIVLDGISTRRSKK